MAGQSITFDFLTRGADSAASGFRKVGDNTLLAARGAKVLADVIGKLGDKEDRTAAESLTLAKALRQTGDAEDRVAARAVVADAAIRRLDDAMQDSNKHSGELSKTLSGLKLNPGLVGPLLALAPAIATLSGVGAGAAAGLGGAFIAGGAALAAFGAVAKPILTDAKKASEAVEKAQVKYNVAIAGGVAPAKAFKAEQKDLAKAYAGLSPAQIALSKQLGAMADAWDQVKTAETPVVTGALQPWLKSVTGLTGALGPIIAKIAPVIASLGGQFQSLVSSSAFTQFRDFIGSTGAAAVSAGGSTIIDLVKSFMILLPKFDPLIREAIGWISRLGPAVLSWSSSKKASEDITKFLQWFSQNGPVVGGLLKNIAGALKAMAPGLTAGGTAELQVMSQFFALIAKLPPGLAKPLFEVAGAMLILQKTGVVSVGIKLTGLATGASAAGAAGGPLTAAGAAIAGGILLGVRHALASGWKTAVSELPKLLEGVGSILNFSANGWSQAILDHFAKPIRKMWSDLGHFMAASFDITRHQVSRAWDVLTSDIVTVFDIAKEGIRVVWDKIEILFLKGEDFIVRTMGKLPGPLGAPFRAAHASIAASLAQIQGDVGTATRNIQADWDRIHGKTVRVNFVGSGSGSIAFKESIPGVTTGPSSGGLLGFHAAGGYIRGGTPGRDSVAAMLMPGEVVVPTSMVNAGAVDHLRGQLPGFATGGMITGMGAAGRIPAAGVPFMANAEAAFGKAVESAFAKAAIAKFKKDMSALGGSGSAIVNYARSFLGKIPYVFGGGSLSGGIDCSGFTQAVYGKFGIHAPRTSEAQYAWATRTGPVPGGLAFYVSPGGGPPPGHVAIVQNATSVISQGGGMGPKIESLHFLPLMGTGVPKGGFPSAAGGGGNGAVSGGAIQAIAQSLLKQYGWGNQWPAFNSLETREAGWNLTARNPSSGAYGLAQFINGPGEYAQYGGDSTTALGQLTAMMNYIGQRYGSPNAAWAHEVADNWYAKGGLVPGYASGGVAGQGAAWLKAWQTRHGGGYGAAWGPVVLNQQIPEMAAAIQRAKALSGATGLSAGQHKFWAATAAGETKRLGVLGKELTTERAWRNQLGVGELGLDKQIRAAGNLPSLAGAVKGWKSMMARDKATVGGISKMLGYSDAFIKAHPAAVPGPVLPTVTHTYGGDVANNIGAVLASALAPFTGAARGGMVFDRGGTLRPGFNPIWNGTGRPEALVPARSGGGKLQIEWVGGNGGGDLEKWIRKNVRVRGGGDVQKAYGAH